MGHRAITEPSPEHAFIFIVAVIVGRKIRRRLFFDEESARRHAEYARRKGWHHAIHVVELEHVETLTVWTGEQ